MKRDFLFTWYQTPRGRLLQALETTYLQQAIQVGCKQTVVQIGGLNWENEFIDCSLYEKFIIVDYKRLGSPEALKIQAKAYALPIQTASVDLVILPHILEFDERRFQTVREVERILKPEGELIILSFNPWNLWLRYQFVLDKKLSYSWSAHFISRTRIIDWLKLLNFEVKLSSEFNINQIDATNPTFKMSRNPLLSMAYAVKAVKRRYNLIPLSPVQTSPIRLALQGNYEPSQRVTNDD
ncbi:MAG: methyltransferase domain-containing protein [Methylococcales bacterium]|nr:methyltransferase domain-containing protein [Methylococcales bacterium]